MTKWFEDIIVAGFSLTLFANCLLFVPQIVRLIKTKNSEDFALSTFIGFFLIQLSALFYGILRNDYLFVLGYVFTLLSCGIVTGLIIYYRGSG